MRTTSPPCIVHPEMTSCHLHSLWGLASAPYYFPFCSLLFLSFIFSFLLFPISFPAASVLCTVTEGVGAAGGNRPAAHPSPSGAPPPCTHWCRTRSVHSPRMRRIRGGGEDPACPWLLSRHQKPDHASVGVSVLSVRPFISTPFPSHPQEKIALTLEGLRRWLTTSQGGGG